MISTEILITIANESPNYTTSISYVAECNYKIFISKKWQIIDLSPIFYKYRHRFRLKISRMFNNFLLVCTLGL